MKSAFKVTASDPSDASFDDFYQQARQIKESELVVGVFVTNKTLNAEQENASVAFLLGFAAGLGKGILALQELPNSPMLDIG